MLPDRNIAWGDVAVGALVTAVLFTLGKSAIGLYVGGAGIAGSFGAAGSLAAVLVWIYYSAIIFLLGAEFTRAWANSHGSRQRAQVPADAREATGSENDEGGVRSPGRRLARQPEPDDSVTS